ncbi:MAG: glutamyl-tRNA reductase [Dehalogenimonas sp.]|uniref:Glutamyl-tRNA reductase n=1 Tax=Candidatus Dehalogenimonas loeffleri TaxID=3127115 RepID=A0ABZ2J6W6_9CHLR|nr:glutamyl-tRNA reductase [Dehalogenimonas sp.]
MQICAVGVAHHTAPVHIRERLAIGHARLPEVLSELQRYVDYGVVLSTCNRTEIYVSGGIERKLEEHAIKFLNDFTGVSFADLLPHIYLKKDASACGHLFRVAGGLDSMIIGEYEILGQINTALEIAEQSKMVNLPLRQLFNQAAGTGRRIREETDISKNALSVSSVAVDLAKQVLGELKGCCVLVIGAGEAGRLVAKAARERGASRLIIYNRSRDKALELAKSLGAEQVTDDLCHALAEADVVVSCTSAPHTVVDYEHMVQAKKRRTRHQVVMVDIAVPRDIDPKVKTLDGVVLYNLDDMTEICNANRNRRQRESLKAMKIISAEADDFLDWWQSLEVKPTVTALIKKAENIRKMQLEQTIKKLPPMSEEQRQNLEAMTRSIVTKVLHDPIAYLKEDSRNKKEYSKMVNEIFRLDREKV